MAPVFQAVGTAQSGVGALTVAWPTHLTNDIGILVIETGGEGTTVSITAPTGWAAITGSPVTDVATTAGSKLQVWWKRAASGAETSVTVPDSGDHQVAAIYTFRGCITTGNPWNAVTTGIKAAASTTATTPDLTTSVTDTLYVAIVGRPDDSASTTHFGTLTNANLTGIASAGEAGTTSGHGGGFVLQYGTFAGVGATGTSTLTKAASTTDTYMVLALASKAGLQAEPGRYFLPERNLRLWSEAFDNAAWTKSNTSVTANATTAPNGTLTADALIENTTQSVQHQVIRNITFISGRTYTASCYFKLYPGPITRQARLGLGTNAAFPIDTHITINLATGAISATQGSPSATSITNEGNGWYRASVTKQYTGAGVTASASIILVNTVGTALYTDADGLSGIYIWGAQYEEGSLSAYDPVGPAAAAITNTTVTRRLVADAGAFTLTGQPAALLKSDLLLGDLGSFTLTGNAADLVRDARLTAATGAFTETGNPATLRTTRSLLSAAGAFTLSGQSAGFLGQRYLPLAPGSFALTGNAATLKATRRLLASAGSIALTGNAAALLPTRFVTAAAGSFTLTGQAATLRPARRLTAATGVFALTGNDAALIKVGAAVLPCATGLFTLTGQPATLRATRSLTAAAGLFTLTGNAAILARRFTLTASAGSFTETGQAASLRRTVVLGSAAGAFTLSGKSAGFQGQRYLPLAPGAFIVTGQAAALRRTVRLTAAAGAFATTGQAAALRPARRLVAASAAFVVTGQAAALRRTVLLAAASGVFTFNGNAADIVVPRRIQATTGSFLLNGQSAVIHKGYILIANSATYTETGNQARLLRGIRLQATTGTLVLSGKSIGFLGQRYLSLNTGSFAASGNAAQLRIARKLLCASGTLLSTGPPVFLRPAFTRRRVIIF